MTNSIHDNQRNTVFLNGSEKIDTHTQADQQRDEKTPQAVLSPDCIQFEQNERQGQGKSEKHLLKDDFITR